MGRATEVATKIIKMMWNSYEEGEACVRMDRKREMYQIRKGIKQEDPYPQIYSTVYTGNIQEFGLVGKRDKNEWVLYRNSCPVESYKEGGVARNDK